MRTSFHHQPEAQHPKFFSYQQAAGRLPHLWVNHGLAGQGQRPYLSAMPRKRPFQASVRMVAKCQGGHMQCSKFEYDRG